MKTAKYRGGSLTEKVKNLGSRGDVEVAVDLSREDKTSSWEGALSKQAPFKNWPENVGHLNLPDAKSE